MLDPEIHRWWPRFPFAVKLALLVLFLSLLYALTFTHMLHVSLVEQVFDPNLNPPRYARPPHNHNTIEWILIIGPAALGWMGVLGSAIYLARRAIRALIRPES